MNGDSSFFSPALFDIVGLLFLVDFPLRLESFYGDRHPWLIRLSVILYVLTAFTNYEPNLQSDYLTYSIAHYKPNFQSHYLTNSIAHYKPLIQSDYLANYKSHYEPHSLAHGN